MSDDVIEDDNDEEIDDIQDSDGSDLDKLVENPKALAERMNEEVRLSSIDLGPLLLLNCIIVDAWLE